MGFKTFKEAVKDENSFKGLFIEKTKIEAVKKNEILKAYEVRTKSTIEIVKIFVKNRLKKRSKEAVKMCIRGREKTKIRKSDKNRVIDVVKFSSKRLKNVQ